MAWWWPLTSSLTTTHSGSAPRAAVTGPLEAAPRRNFSVRFSSLAGNLDTHRHQRLEECPVTAQLVHVLFQGLAGLGIALILMPGLRQLRAKFSDFGLSSL